MEVLGNHVRVLADEAERGTEIDVSQAEKDLRHAEGEMLDPAVSIDIASALIAWQHAKARIDAARKQVNKEE